jgi:nitrous oxidase accessory protein NosD
VSENTVVSAPVGVDIENNGVSVSSNTIYNAIGCGLFCNTGVGIGIYANSAAATVTGNTVAQSGIGIYFNCAAAKNVHGNTILDATLGLFGVPSGTVSINTYYNVGQINPSGTC